MSHEGIISEYQIWNNAKLRGRNIILDLYPCVLEFEKKNTKAIH